MKMWIFDFIGVIRFINILDCFFAIDLTSKKRISGNDSNDEENISKSKSKN